MKPIRALFENGVFRPLDPVALAERSEVLVEPVSGRPRSRESILTILRRELPRLRAEYGVERLVIFGSMARDEAGADSDLDIAVEFCGSASFERLVDLSGDLTYLLGRPADVIALANAKPAILRAIHEEGVVV